MSLTIPQPRLLLITDPSLGKSLIPALTAALRGGARHVLLRDKSQSRKSLAILAGDLLELVRSHNGYLLIHGHPKLVQELDADGAHLPETGITTENARHLLGNNHLLGRSCHSVAAARDALAAGADYVTLSPVFATRSHVNAIPLGLKQFEKMVKKIPGPVLALGGINANNAASAMAHGASGIALIRGILEAVDVEKTTRMLLHTTLSNNNQAEFFVAS